MSIAPPASGMLSSPAAGDDASWTFLVCSSIAALAVSYWVLLLRSSGWKRDDYCDAPPTAPAGIFETIRDFSGPNAPFFVLKMAKLTNSLICRINLPIRGGVYIIGDSAAQREVFLDATTDKPAAIYKAFSQIGGTPSVFTRVTADPHWKYARKGSAPAFSSKEVSRMNRICSQHLERWIQNVLQPLVEKNETFDPSQEMIRLTFRIIMESAFEYQSTDEEYEEFVHHLEVALREFTFKQSINPFRSTFGVFIPEVRHAMQSCHVLRRYALKILNTYRATPPHNKSPQNTLIRLIEENQHFTDDNIKVSELLTYMVAGFDTTGYTLATTLVLLAKHPDICTKARESLLQGTMMMPPSSLKPSDYVRNVVSESNRLCPVAAMGSIREAGRDYTFTTQDGKSKFRIPKGAALFMPQIVPNYDPTIYPDPESFLPERWNNATEEMQKGLLTFALGNRNCIGQSLATAEINSVLPRLLSEYSFELVDEGQMDYFLTLKYSGARLRAVRLQTQ